MPMPVFNDNNELVYVEMPEIFTIYKDPDTRKIIITAECGEYYLPSTIEHIETIMSNLGFMKIDRNRIINLSKVKKIVKSDVYIDSKHFYVTREKRKIIEKIIENTSRNENC